MMIGEKVRVKNIMVIRPPVLWVKRVESSEGLRPLAVVNRSFATSFRVVLNLSVTEVIATLDGVCQGTDGLIVLMVLQLTLQTVEVLGHVGPIIKCVLYPLEVLGKFSG
jgi:hypothetical protein